MSQPIISVKSLWQLRNHENLVVLYTRLADIKTGELESIGQKVILDAQLFDFESTFVDENSPLPHTMCSAEKFQREVRKLGINADSHVVVYDSHGYFSAPRVWWMFKSMGHQKVQVLDGGIKAWTLAGNPVSDKLTMSNVFGDFNSTENPRCFVNSDVIVNTLDYTDQHVVVDARASGRFQGIQPEPRSGVRSGHIPNSINLPFQSVIENGFLKSPEQLTKIFQQLGLSEQIDLYFSCGSGVTACVLAIAAYSIGYENLHVYDGSWTEWGSDTRLPIEV